MCTQTTSVLPFHARDAASDPNGLLIRRRLGSSCCHFATVRTPSPLSTLPSPHVPPPQLGAESKVRIRLLRITSEQQQSRFCTATSAMRLSTSPLAGPPFLRVNDLGARRLGKHSHICTALWPPSCLILLRTYKDGGQYTCSWLLSRCCTRLPMAYAESMINARQGRSVSMAATATGQSSLKPPPPLD